MLERITRFLGIKTKRSLRAKSLQDTPLSQDPKLKQDIKEFFNDMDRLKKAIFAYLEQKRRSGDRHTGINNHVVNQFTNNARLTESLLQKKWIRGRLAEARQELKREGRVGYSFRQDIWYIKTISIRNLTEKEKKFLSAQGLGPGWRNIPNEMEAIKWLWHNFSPTEFENFCIAILNHHCGVPIKITEKRRISGADGGLDGTGEYEINGKIEKVALEAKRYALDCQVGEDRADRFVGALVKNGWRHGFFITTGTFSARFQESVRTLEDRDIWIELIDQERLVKIMLEKVNLPHGFGLHRTDRGLIYINEDILKRAASGNEL